ncbi:hypothetical protein GCM10010123_01840 [Pilimelia anulata]|uniref:CYTH domain-containing protein n=1 Tax=Pilimelia anulata TaxID=53371 RepID=A0A8J3B665_9ACTN|nr:adenylate cyclase [Pilimelia anulata]GGJ75473.1 hypothetical protein GCM10010123_01840 [Pilimelia anulata]
MRTEYEARILDITPAAVEQAILRSGGHRCGDTALLRRHIYPLTAGEPDGQRWLQLRSKGSGATLTVQDVNHGGIEGVGELEIGVDDYESTCQLLAAIGHEITFYQERRRTMFVLAGAKISIDQWPMIPPFLEIEADNADEVYRTAATLGFTAERVSTGGDVYQQHGIDHTAYPRLAFDETLTL